VASVPTAWRTLKEIAGGGTRTDKRITTAVNTARRHAWTQVTARHGALPGVRLADKLLDGVVLHPARCHRHRGTFGQAAR
jgi:hypothetical protein